jgi:hypothetical protein
MQRLETEPANLPDSYTYTALMRGVLISGRVELAQQVNILIIVLIDSADHARLAPSLS